MNVQELLNDINELLKDGDITPETVVESHVVEFNDNNELEAYSDTANSLIVTSIDSVSFLLISTAG